MFIFILVVIAVPFTVGVIVAIPICILVAMAYWKEG